jgi:hypothetical protein
MFFPAPISADCIFCRSCLQLHSADTKEEPRPICLAASSNLYVWCFEGNTSLNQVSKGCLNQLLYPKLGSWHLHKDWHPNCLKKVCNRQDGENGFSKKKPTNEWEFLQTLVWPCRLLKMHWEAKTLRAKDGVQHEVRISKGVKRTHWCNKQFAQNEETVQSLETRHAECSWRSSKQIVSVMLNNIGRSCTPYEHLFRYVSLV